MLSLELLKNALSMFTNFVIPVCNDLYFLGLFIEDGFYSRLGNVIDCFEVTNRLFAR